MWNRRFRVTCTVLAAAVGLATLGGYGPSVWAAEAPASAAPDPATMKLADAVAETKAIDAEHLAKARKLLHGGLGYLLKKREASGGWSFGGGMMTPAITAMVTHAMLQNPGVDRNDPVVSKALALIVSYQQKDGAIFDPKQGQQAYTTAIALSTLAAAKDPKLTEAIRKATDYLKGLQIQPGQESADGGKIGEDDPRVGGVGYGKNGEPNLSVLSYVIDGWHDAGIKPDDEAMKRAVRFLTRMQNRSESNPMAWAKEGSNDGGFAYDQKTSKAGEGPEGKGKRSYGSMTYSGFKSMLYAGVDKQDPRVQAAYAWIRRYWRLDSNPNMPARQSREGLFYYYHVFAKALRAWGQDEITDLKNVKHNWRHELIDALTERVSSDGSWTNKDASRWDEGNPVLATCYGVLALQAALKK